MIEVNTIRQFGDGPLRSTRFFSKIESAKQYCKECRKKLIKVTSIIEYTGKITHFDKTDDEEVLNKFLQ